MEITKQSLREIFDYQDGYLLWKRPPHKKGPQVIGEKAGCIDALGYWRIGLDKKRHYAHRLIWIWHHGTNPSMIDHINCERADNRIENLRGCTKAENMRNSRKNAANKSGVKGVCWVGGKWKAVVGYNCKHYHVGYFKDIKEAEKALQQKRVELHKEFANHG